MAINIKYELSFADKANHIAEVSIQTKIAKSKKELVFFMPSWSPGSYLMREYGRNVRRIYAASADNSPLPVQQVDKNRWIVQVGDLTDISLTYEVFCHELTVRTSHIDNEHAFIHGPATFMGIEGFEKRPTVLKLNMPKEWKTICTGLTRSKQSKSLFKAADYDELLDCPLEIGNSDSYSFDVKGIPHTADFYGPDLLPSREHIIDDIKKICEYEIDYIGEFPCDDYHFMSHIFPTIYGGLEHRNSTALQYCSYGFTKRKDYIQWLALVSHEYFHTWNVKRIRPQAFSEFDYCNENYTSMLWLAEGLTSFLDDIFVYQAGLCTIQEYLRKIKDDLNRFESIPGRFFHSLEESSFNAWIKLYRADENHNNSSVSYYLKGGLVFSLLNIMLIENGSSTQELVRRLWADYKARPEQGINTEEFLAIIEDLTNKECREDFKALITEKEEIDFEAWFESAGLKIERTAPTKAQFNMTVEYKGERVFIKTIPLDSPARRAGLAPGDELLALDSIRLTKKPYGELSDKLVAEQVYELLYTRNGIVKSTQIEAVLEPSVIKEIHVNDLIQAEKFFKHC